jgi:DNA replication licensing factor MCM2
MSILNASKRCALVSPYYFCANTRHARNTPTANKESLILSWVQLAEQVPVLAAWVADAPSEMLPILDEVTMLEVKLLFPEYQQIHPEVHVRIADLPVVDSIRDIR